MTQLHLDDTSLDLFVLYLIPHDGEKLLHKDTEELKVSLREFLANEAEAYLTVLVLKGLIGRTEGEQLKGFHERFYGLLVLGLIELAVPVTHLPPGLH